MSTADAVPRGPLAGAGRAEIALPDELFPVDGYQGVHDPLHARALVLDDDGTRHVLVSLELPSVRDDEVERLRRGLAALAATSPERVWVSVTHTLSAPHTRSDAALADPDVARRDALLRGRLEAAAEVATSSALAGLAPCLVGSGTTSAPLTVNRDLHVGEGWTSGAEPGRHSDHTLTAVRIDGRDGAPVAVLYGYDLRSSVTDGIDPERRLVSADCTGAASRAVEEAWGGVALFLPGAMADQMPAPTRAPTGYQASDTLGATMAEHVLGVVRRSTVRAPGRVEGGRTRTEVPVRTSGGSSATSADPTAALDLELLTIGEVALLGMRPELTSVLGSRIREASSWPQTLVCTMVNGGAKYLVDDEAHDEGTRTAQASPFGRGAGTAVVDAARALLRSARNHQEQP